MSMFQYWPNLVGGATIGLSAASLLLMNGDILGASGITSSTFLHPIKTLQHSSNHWKLAFLASFFSVGAFLLGPKYDLAEANAQSRPLSMLGYAVAGFFVGFGTRLGNGCTSGHGICGLARLSKRSLAAVGSFMASGILTAILTDPASKFAHLTSFLRTDSVVNDKIVGTGIAMTAVLVGAALVSPLFHHNGEPTKDDRAKCIGGVLSGALFSGGLFLSQMIYPGKVFGFLKLTGLADGTWDPALVFVMGGGVIVSFISYQFLEKHRVFGNTKPIEHPICLSKDCEFGIPNTTVIDRNLLLGSILFGVGWGVGGICPGPALFLAAAGVPGILMAWLPSFLAGSFLAHEYKTHMEGRLKYQPISSGEDF
jgi:uncharacterized membrane protein YedE/YeeE